MIFFIFINDAGIFLFLKNLRALNLITIKNFKAGIIEKNTKGCFINLYNCWILREKFLYCRNEVNIVSFYEWS